MSEQLQKFETRVPSFVERASAIEIVDQPTYDAAVENLKVAKAMRAEVYDAIHPTVDAANKAHKEAVALFQKFDGPLARIELWLKGKIAKFMQDQEMKRLEQQAVAEAAAKADLQDQADAKAAVAEAAGAPVHEVEAIRAEPSTAPTPKVEPTYRPAAGVSLKGKWRGECTDFRALVQAAAKDDRYLGLLQVHQTALNALAVSQNKFFSVPGCRAVQDPVVASSRC